MSEATAVELQYRAFNKRQCSVSSHYSKVNVGKKKDLTEEEISVMLAIAQEKRSVR